MAIEKRRQKRFKNRVEVQVQKGVVTRRGFANSFSLNGMFVKTSLPFATGATVDVKLHISKDVTSQIKGKVIRADKKLMGMVFGTPSKQLKNGMGIEITEKDENYLHLIRYLLYCSKTAINKFPKR